MSATPSSRNVTRVGGATFGNGSDAVFAGLLALIVFLTVGTWLSGQVAGLLFRFTWPHVPFGDAFSIVAHLPRHWGDPRLAWPAEVRRQLPGPVGFYTATLVVLAAMVTVLAVGVRWWRTSRQPRGMASHAQLNKALTAAAVLRKGRRLRPTLVGRPKLSDVAVPLGTVGSTRLYASLESSVLLLAAPRQGKTSQVIIPWLRSFPGPAVITSVRHDVLEATATLRPGTAWVMELTGDLAWPHRIQWSPIAGCESFDVARKRADVMIQVGKQDTADSSNAGFFGLTATNLMAAWLHTAALTGKTMDDVLSWSNHDTDDTPVTLLRDAPNARDGVVAMLDGFYRMPASTRSNVWTTVQTGTSCLFGEAAARVFGGRPADSFDIERFLRSEGDTIYLLVGEDEADRLAPLVTTFVTEITTTAKRLALRAPNGRLDPPLGMILDEVANVVPLPQLPELMSYAAGSGIFVTAVLHSLAAAELRWRTVGRKMLWANSTIKIALGGLAGEDLDDFVKLAGSYRETLVVPQHNHLGLNLQATVVDRHTMDAEQVRTLDEDRREALVIHATTPAVTTRMLRFYEGRDRKHYERAIRDAKQLMDQASRVAVPSREAQ
jgi:type IV secretion system protein VirD4